MDTIYSVGTASNLKKVVDSADANNIYIGHAVAGIKKDEKGWQIKKIVTAGDLIEDRFPVVNGREDASFSYIWNERGTIDFMGIPSDTVKVTESFPTLDTLNAAGSGTFTLSGIISNVISVEFVINTPPEIIVPTSMGSIAYSSGEGSDSIAVSYVTPNAEGEIDVSILMRFVDAGGYIGEIESYSYTLFQA